MKNSFGLRVDYISILINVIILQIFAINPKHPWDEDSTITYSTCKTYKCLERSRYIEDSVDTSANPCDDFYQYTCGRWIEKNPVPTTEAEYSIETYLKLITMKRIQHLLEQNDHPVEKEEIKVARRLYRECMKRHELGRINAKTIKFHLTKQRSWSLCSVTERIIDGSKSWVTILIYYMEISNDMPLFSIFVGLDKNNEPIIQVEEPSNPFAMLDIIKWNEKKEQFYMKFLKQTIKSLNLPEPEHCTIDEYIYEVILFRRQLDEFRMKMAENSAKFPEEMTIDQFQDWYDNETADLRSRVWIPWLNVIRAAYPTINSARIDKRTKINVRNKEYFQLLATLIDKTPIRTIVNHIQLYFIERHLKMNSKLINSLKEVILHDDTFFDDLIMDTDELHFCIMDHPMKDTLANMYNEAYLTKEMEKDVYALADDVKDMLLMQIAESRWLDKALKLEIENKLSRTKIFIGIMDASENNVQLPLLNKRNKSVTKIAPFILPDAAYVLKSEYISIGTGYLQSPIYDEDLPYVTNYGSLGSLIGHEYFHTVQTALSTKYNAGKKMKQLLTSDMYMQKSKCFIDHYKHFEVKDLKDLPSNCYVMPDLVRSVDENVADTMGLKVAYEAYRKKLWQNKNVCPRPPNLQYSCDQHFFLSFALTFCGNIPSMEIRKMLKRLTYLPPRIRVNGAVSNLQAFNDAFQCPKKAPLNSKKKCDIWK